MYRGYFSVNVVFEQKFLKIISNAQSRNNSIHPNHVEAFQNLCLNYVCKEMQM